MKTTRILNQGASLLLLVMMLLTVGGGCAALAEVPPTEREGEIRRVVEVEVDGLTVHYLCQSFWREKEFSSYLANQAQFKSDFKENFEPGLAKAGVSASYYSFSFDSVTRSIVIRCDIRNAISLKTGGEYYTRFGWLLNPLGLDFIDDDFEESANGFSWEGFVKGVPMNVTVELPNIHGSVYKVWEHPIGHCHAHAWWSD